MIKITNETETNLDPENVKVKINIVKLTNGETIIGLVSEDQQNPDILYIAYPAEITFHKTEDGVHPMMYNWVPMILTVQEVYAIPFDMVVTMAEPLETICKVYYTWCNKITEMSANILAQIEDSKLKEEVRKSEKDVRNENEQKLNPNKRKNMKKLENFTDSNLKNKLKEGNIFISEKKKIN